MLLTETKKDLIISQLDNKGSVNHLETCHLLAVHAEEAIEIIKSFAEEKEGSLYIQYEHSGCEVPLKKCDSGFYCEECDLTFAEQEVFASTYYLVKK